MRLGRLLPVLVLVAQLVLAGLPAAADETDDRVAALTDQLAGASDADRPRLMIELGTLLRQSDPDRSLELATGALELARARGDSRLTADAVMLQGLAHLTVGRYELCLAAVREAETLYRQLGDDHQVARCLGFQGMALSDLGQLWPAIETVEKALDTYRKLDDRKGVAAATNNLGVYYAEVGDYETALRYNLESLEIERALGRTHGIANNLNSIGNIHARQDDPERAREYYKQALELFQAIDDPYGEAQCLNNLGNTCEDQDRNDEALVYYERALEVARRLDRPSLEANPLLNMGIVYKKKGDFDRALKSYLQAAEIEERMGEQAELALALQNIGELFLLMDKPTDALTYLRRAESIATETQAHTALSGTYLNLAEAYAQLGDYKNAHACLVRHCELRDASLDEERRKIVAELQARYDADRRREQIELLTKDNEIKKLQLSRTRLTAILTMAVAVLVVGAAALLLRRYRSLLAFWRKKVFIGPYRVEDEISTGGMGVVYRATNVLEPGTPIALKVIRDELAGDATQRRRFVNEGRIIDSIRHPHIVRVFDRGENNERLYIAMEYLSGLTLAEIIRDAAARGERIAVPRAVCLMEQLAEAAAAIHAMGIVHRDIKPSNVMVTASEGDGERVKLLDFGTAKLDTMTTLTTAGELVGTVSYLAPERIRCSEPTPASDVFSLGVVLYELLTFERPFPAEEPAVLIKQLLETDPVAPAVLRPDLGAALSELVMTMLSKDASRRPNDDELLHRLGLILAEVTP